jgi:hypothetical protein
MCPIVSELHQTTPCRNENSDPLTTFVALSFGCESARAGQKEGSCPTSLEEIPVGAAGVIEAHDRLQYLSLSSVVDDIAFVVRFFIFSFDVSCSVQIISTWSSSSSPFWL